MHSAPPHNAIANPNNNDGIRHQRKRNASDVLTDHHEYVSPITNRRLISSAANDSNGGSGPRGFHEPRTMAESSKREDIAYLESFPIGYRFCPTDQELLRHYLLKKIKNENLPKNKIGDVDIYGDHPEKIVENQPQAKEGQWYFFSPRSRKYVNGSRPDRKAGCGYWKATGPDKKIMDDNGVIIGDKKSLVYYEGNPPNGMKTSWIMQEYVVAGHQRPRFDKHDMKLDDYVLCKIYTKENRGQKLKTDQVRPSDQESHEALNNQDDSNQNANPTVERVPIPDEQAGLISNQEPIPKQAVPPMQHPKILHLKNNMAVHNSLSYCHPSMGSHHDMRFGQPVVPPLLYPPPTLAHVQLYSEGDYLIMPPQSCYVDTLDMNWSGPSYNQQPLQQTSQIADDGIDGSEYIEYSEAGFSDDDCELKQPEVPNQEQNK